MQDNIFAVVACRCFLTVQFWSFGLFLCEVRIAQVLVRILA